MKYQDKYCIRINAQNPSNNSISILQNNNIIETILQFRTHLRCFDEFNLNGDVFELRNEGLYEVSHYFIKDFFEISSFY